MKKGREKITKIMEGINSNDKGRKKLRKEEEKITKTTKGVNIIGKRRKKWRKRRGEKNKWNKLSEEKLNNKRQVIIMEEGKIIIENK